MRSGSKPLEELVSLWVDTYMSGAALQAFLDRERELTATALRDLGLRTTLADIGQTVAANFGVSIATGTSFLGKITS